MDTAKISRNLIREVGDSAFFYIVYKTAIHFFWECIAFFVLLLPSRDKSDKLNINQTKNSMKNLFKIFLAVAALFAYACATDTTEDLGVNLGGETTITLSLEESRTQLGEKADGVYPLFWSEGDAISINGVASNGLTAQQAGSSVATFTVQGTLATPYCIAYPAAPAGQVIFAENQTHAGNNSFGNGVSTMFAYGTEAGVALHHLTGVLKFGITGAEKLSLVQVRSISTLLRARLRLPRLRSRLSTTRSARALSFRLSLPTFTWQFLLAYTTSCTLHCTTRMVA